MRVGALCAGYGGIELGLILAGVDVDLVWYSEIDPDVERVLAHHYPKVPNVGDLTMIDEVAPVDVVTAGFPCQPVSHAGGRKGVHDERWLIDDVVGVWQRSGARWLVLENVSGLYSANDGEAFGRVVDALAEVGASAEWTHLRASDVGACHRRDRWFCVAESADSGGVGRLEGSGSREGEPSGLRGNGPHDDNRADALTLLPSPMAANPNDGEPLSTWQARHDRHAGKAEDATRSGIPLAVAVQTMPTPTSTDAKASGSGINSDPSNANLTDVTTRGLVDFGRFGPAIEQHERLVAGRPAPPPMIDGRLSPVFVEWMMGLPAGWVTEVPSGQLTLFGDPSPVLSRAQQLRILGNGVVPQQAAEAIRRLAETMERETAR